MSPAAKPSKSPKLPFWSTLGRAYGGVLRNFGFMLALFGRWLLVLLPIQIGWAWWIHPTLVAAIQSIFTGIAIKSSPWEPVAQIAVWLLMLVPASIIAVGVHRRLLDGDVAAETYAPSEKIVRQLDGPVTGYVTAAAILMVIGAMPSVGFDLLPQTRYANVPAIGLAVFVATWLVIAVTVRLSLALPAIAVQGPGQSFREAWAVTRRNTLRLCLGTMVSMLPMIVVGLVTFGFAALISDRMVFALIGGILNSIGALFLVFSVAYLSYAWRHFWTTAPRQT